MEYRRANCFTRYRVRNYEKGDYIAFRGDRVKELSIVVRGAINVSFVTASGLIIRSIDHNAPAPIGAIAIYSNDGRYMVDTKAIDSCVVISVAKDEITSQLQRCQEFMINFINFSASRVDLLSGHLALLSQRSIAAKLAYYILICSEDGVEYRFKKSIGNLSEYLCVERPSLSRAIAKFVDNGLITYTRGSGKILDPEELKNFVE